MRRTAAAPASVARLAAEGVRRRELILAYVPLWRSRCAGYAVSGCIARPTNDSTVFGVAEQSEPGQQRYDGRRPGRGVERNDVALRQGAGELVEEKDHETQGHAGAGE